jgi:hypothetical protein
MPSISGLSLLAVQTYATQTAAPARPSGPVERTAATARAESGAAFSVALSDAATKAMAVAQAPETGFRPFVSAADMGARPAAPSATVASGATAADTRPAAEAQRTAAARPGPAGHAGAPVRHQRPGTYLDIKV